MPDRGEVHDPALMADGAVVPGLGAEVVDRGAELSYMFDVRHLVANQGERMPEFDRHRAPEQGMLGGRTGNELGVRHEGVSAAFPKGWLRTSAMRPVIWLTSPGPGNQR